MNISAGMVIAFGGVLAVIITLGKILFAVYDFVKHSKEQDDQIAHIVSTQERILEENALLIDGIHACLDGLTQLNCNHIVPQTKERIYNYLNQETHKIK